MQRSLLVSLILCTGTAAWGQAELLDGFGGPDGYGANLVAPNDDLSEGPIEIRNVFGVGLNFYGAQYPSLYLNTNGNVSFNAGIETYTPLPFPVAEQPMIAPYWADVDTRGRNVSNALYWHSDVEGGRFIATWNDVGYYNSRTDLLNSFQLILTDRSDAAPGDFTTPEAVETLKITREKADGPSEAGTAEKDLLAGQGGLKGWFAKYW